MSLLRGEFWITDDSFCPEVGNNSDTNHEGYAAQTALGQLLSLVGYDDDEPTENDLAQAFYSYLRDQEPVPPDLTEEYLADYPTMFDWAIPFLLKENPDHTEESLVALYECARSIGDCRVYAAKTWKWKTVHDHHIGTWTLTAEDLSTISRGLDEIVGYLDEEQEESAKDETVYINIGSTNRQVEISLADLLDRNYETIQVAIEQPIGPNAQVTAMDRAIQEPYYANKPQGD